MKKLFTIACTLVLGSALSFAQAAGSTGGQTPAGDQTKTSTSTSTKKHHHHGKKSSKKKKAADTAAPAAAPAPSPK